LFNGIEQRVDQARQLWATLQSDPAEEPAGGQDAVARDSVDEASDEVVAATDDGEQPGDTSAGGDELAAAGGEGDASASAEPAAEGGARTVAAKGPEPTERPGSTAADEPDATIPRISLARLAPQLPEVAVSELPELTLDGSESVPALMRQWGYVPEGPVDCDGLSGFGLDCERSQERWSDLRLFDRPVALQLMVDGVERYAVVTGLDDEFARLQRGERSGRVPIAILDERWSGDVLMLWRLPPGGTRMIGPGTEGDAVQWLRERLAALPDATLNDVSGTTYDIGLREAVRAFQSGRGLVVDGLAGPRTLIMLNNALSDTEIPRLSQSQTR
jgi:general secretion pathway protein A